MHIGKDCPGGCYYTLRDYFIGRWNGALIVRHQALAAPKTVLASFDPDGPGPCPSTLVSGGDSAPFIETMSGFSVPTITRQPQDVIARLGRTVFFSVEAAPAGVTFQWSKTVPRPPGSNPLWRNLSDGPQPSGAVISGATTPTLVIENFQTGELSDSTAGTAQYRCYISQNDPARAVNSRAALLTISPCTPDFNRDGDTGTDADIEAFFACLAGNCCPACDPLGVDFNGDGDHGTDQDIESFFRVLAGGSC
jgi:hypothetical protein